MKSKILQFLLIALFMAALPTAAVAALNGFGPLDADNGFPKWYQDANGLALGQCLESNRFCHLPLAGEQLGFNPFQPVDFPANFPAEFSFFIAEASIANTLTSPLKSFELSLSGGFFAELPLAGDQVALMLLALRVDNILTTGDYAIVHPYGVQIFRNVQAGGIIRVDPPEIFQIAVRQDFETPRQQFVGPFLQSADAANRDVRDPVTGNIYLTNPLTPVAVSGSPNGTNFVRVDRVLLNADNTAVAQVLETIAETDQFFLFGKKVSAMSASPGTLAFPEQNIAPAFSDNIVTVTNESTLRSPRIGPVAAAGANAADFTVPAGLDGCSNREIEPSASCSFTVRFSGSAGSIGRTATVTIPGAASAFTSLNIPVSGTIDSVPPAVTAAFPGNGGSAPANMRIIAQFDDLLDPATVNPSTFTVTAAGGNPVAGAVSFDVNSNIAVFTPSAPLDNGVVHTAIIAGAPGGITDSVGNPMQADFTWSFTGAAADATQPSIVSTNPANGSGGFPTNTPLVITFSEPMLGFTVNSSTILLSSAAGPVSGTVAFDVQTNSATFTPSAPLAFGTAHTLAVSGVQDLAGNPAPAGFTTGFVSNFKPAAPLLLSPSSGTASVARPVTLRWIMPVDQDGDQLTFRVSVCNNASFVGSGVDCQQVTVTAAASAVREKEAGLAGIGSGPGSRQSYVTAKHSVEDGKASGVAGLGIMGMVFGLAGVFILSGRGGRRMATTALMACVVIAGMFLHSCGGGGGGGLGVQPAQQGEASVQVSGLSPGITFFWKVEADDGKGGTTASDVFSFSTQ